MLTDSLAFTRARGVYITFFFLRRGIYDSAYAQAPLPVEFSRHGEIPLLCAVGVEVRRPYTIDIQSISFLSVL